MMVDHGGTTNPHLQAGMLDAGLSNIDLDKDMAMKLQLKEYGAERDDAIMNYNGGGGNDSGNNNRNWRNPNVGSSSNQFHRGICGMMVASKSLLVNCRGCSKFLCQGCRVVVQVHILCRTCGIAAEANIFVVQSGKVMDEITDQENALENLEMDTTENVSNNDVKRQPVTTMRISGSGDFPDDPPGGNASYVIVYTRLDVCV